ncbi:uncharacterized protein LOC144149268 [Haemaphysalis longicornis]
MLNPVVDPCLKFPQHVCGRFGGKVGDDYVTRDFSTKLKPLISYAENAASKLRAFGSDAREKASYYVVTCTNWFNTRSASHSDHASVVRFMGRLGLALSSAPRRASPPTGEELLSLHVELAFTYGLSAVMIIRPRPHNSLHVAFNGRMMQAALTRVDDADYAKNLAGMAGVAATTSLITSRTTVYSKMKVAVTSGATKLVRATVPTPLAVSQVKDVRFAGLSSGAFTAAVEAKTPYNRSATLYRPDLLESVVSSVWAELSAAELLLWTSWHVVDEVAPFADPVKFTGQKSPAYSRAPDRNAYRYECLRMVAHIFEPALVALYKQFKVGLDTPAAVTDMTTAMATCLSKNQWMDSFTKPGQILLGLPSVAKDTKTLSKYYKPVPWGNLSFFSSWVQGATKWSKIVRPDADNFDPLYSEVEVTTGGALVVPVLFLHPPYFNKGAPSAANVGGIGHLIARSLAKRYVKPGASVPAECLGSPGTPLDGEVENLLAYACLRPAMVATNAQRERHLPQLPSLTPEGVMYVVACLKDCAKRDRGAAKCNFPPFERMKHFNEAFSCKSKEPLCNIL